MYCRRYFVGVSLIMLSSLLAIGQGYTNQDVWTAYSGFNNALLEVRNIFIKRILLILKRLTGGMELLQSGASQFIGIWQ